MGLRCPGRLKQTNRRKPILVSVLTFGSPQIMRLQEFVVKFIWHPGLEKGGGAWTSDSGRELWESAGRKCIMNIG